MRFRSAGWTPVLFQGPLWYNRIAMHTERQAQASEAAIFSRVLANGKKRLSPALARHILRLAFTDSDKARMRELALKNQDGALSADERQELENYVRVGDLLTILKAQARPVLRRPARS